MKEITFCSPGNVLRGLRVREELTQKELARRVNCSPAHISDMEHDRRPIGKEMARRLVEALGTDYRVFL